jgi:hypothetical protein
MLKLIRKPAFALLATAAFFSCSDDDVTPDLRPDMDYSTLKTDASYSEQFKNEAGQTTVDLSEGNNRLRMFQALNYYSSSNISAKTSIDAAKLKSLYANSGNPFVDISTSTISVKGETLNNSGVQLRNVTGASLSGTAADAERAKIEADFNAIAAASAFLNQTAEKGKAGRLGTYLVDAKGIEIIQIIQKSLIGSLQLDYIGNVLLKSGLAADNHALVSGKNYTQLEHNWDEAYGLLTLNAVYLYDKEKGVASTDLARATVEFGLGAYVWEYNKASYPKFFPAFVKGRAAIVNNDRAELEAQAIFIRTEAEKAIANAALGYLEKWKATGDNVTDATRAHAIGEGLGFIYSLRFATIHGGDAAWSDSVINGLVGSENGFWDLTVTKINTASDAIKAKFKL